MRNSKTDRMNALRFSGLALDDRFETALACEIWLDDACNARWATNNTMKLAAVIVQGVKNNDGRAIEVSRLDTLCSMTRDDAWIALRQMRMFGLLADFKLEDGVIEACCQLSHSGRIRFLDMKQKFDLLDGLKRQQDNEAEPRPLAGEAISIAMDAIAPPVGAASNIVAFRPRTTVRSSSPLAHEGTLA